MLPCPAWTLLVIIIYILEHATGGVTGTSFDVLTGKIYKPRDITTESRNFSLFLTWGASPKNPPDVAYVVSYKMVAESRWKTVSECNRTHETKCDLTCVLKNYTHQYKLRVKAVSTSEQTSPWAELNENISYMFTVVLDPPTLHIILEDGTMIVNITPKMPHCMPLGLRNLITYVLEIKDGKNATEEIDIIVPSTTIKAAKYEGEYCMAAKAKLNACNKISRLSNQVCLNFTQKDETVAIPLVTILSVMFTILLVMCCIMFIWLKTTHIAKMPKALDIANNKGVLSVFKMPTDKCHSVTVNQNMDQSSSATFLLCNEQSDENDYPGCGYTERQNLGSSRRDGHDEESTSDEYRSSKGLSVTSSSKNPSSDSSCCAETSGTRSEIDIVLIIDKIQLNNGSEKTEMNTETLDPNNMTLGPLLDTLCIQDSNCTSGGSDNVPLNTLSIAAAPEDLELSDNAFYDLHSTDSEDGHEQLTSDCTDYNPSISYIGTEQSQRPQRDCCSGYEKQGYMSRRF